MFPVTYDQWKQCITRDCGIPLTRPFVAERIAELTDADNAYTDQFIRLYGAVHHSLVLTWFHKALNETPWTLPPLPQAASPI